MSYRTILLIVNFERLTFFLTEVIKFFSKNKEMLKHKFLNVKNSIEVEYAKQLVHRKPVGLKSIINTLNTETAQQNTGL